MATHINKFHTKLFMLLLVGMAILYFYFEIIPAKYVLGITTVHNTNKNISVWQYPVIWKPALQYLQNLHLSQE